ncbi:protease-4 [Halovenus aranensis]|uniref:Protease-4 n=1 Tax=Halovenus aranensis TaxID=890420 RepID=A0A1G8U616_9EURY|nr:S49 family peptidase [Halovenus aranensis]SDJ49187.1 protease-4 [Halovenus aranensis]
MSSEDSAEGNDSPAAQPSENAPEGRPSTGSPRQFPVVLVAAVAAVLAGIVVLTLVFGVAGGSSADGTVAVVSIEGPIAEPIGENLESELRDIRANDSIDAVVLKMNTPGGSPQPTERMYMAIQRTSKEMPVIASVQGLSASAGYYMMLPAEDIYVLPSSQVGSVGLAASAPRPQPPVRGPSGPDKRGSNVIQAWARQETLGNIFIDTVMEQRGDRIELSRAEVSTAKLFLGVNSVENGYADKLGSLDDAIDDAAESAGLDEYRIAERNVGGLNVLPIFAQTEHGIVAIYDENPSVADIRPVDTAMVYKPAIPHLSELEAVASPSLDDVVSQAVSDEKEGEQP